MFCSVDKIHCEKESLLRVVEDLHKRLSSLLFSVSKPLTTQVFAHNNL
jgi:hypothetical protein